MFGKLISGAIKIATCPIDVVGAGMDVLCGGNGSKASRKMTESPLSILTDIRDAACKTIEDIDKESTDGKD